MGSTLIVSLMGSIEPHEWARRRYADGADDDAFILLARQSVMQAVAGFHPPAEPARILWHQHDAGDAWTGSADPPELIWLQVETARSGRGRVPLQPIGMVLEKTLRKVGTPQIVQGDFLLPLREFDGDPIELAYDRDWFEFSDPARSEAIGIELYASAAGNADANAASVADRARPWLGGAASLEAHDIPAPGPPEFRGTPDLPQLEFLGRLDCTAREWSVELLAWLSELLGHALHATHCGDHALVRLRRG